MIVPEQRPDLALSSGDLHTLQGQAAGFVTRLAAFLIDLVILSALYSLTAISLQAIGNFFQRDLIELAQVNVLAAVVASVAAVLFPLVYFTFFWALTGQTPGKAFMGVRIYALDGGRLSLRQALLRYISYWLSTALCFGGFLLVLVDDRRQTLHDKIARTVVVYVWEARMHRLVAQRARRGLIPPAQRRQP